MQNEPARRTTPSRWDAALCWDAAHAHAHTQRLSAGVQHARNLISIHADPSFPNHAGTGVRTHSHCHRLSNGPGNNTTAGPAARQACTRIAISVAEPPSRPLSCPSAHLPTHRCLIFECVRALVRVCVCAWAWAEHWSWPRPAAARARKAARMHQRTCAPRAL